MVECNTTVIPGFDDGEPGLDGYHAFNRLALPFTQVDVDSNVTITVLNEIPWSSNFIGVGMVMAMPSKGYYQVVSISGATIVLKRLEGDGIMPEASTGTVVGAGTYVYVGSISGSEGPIGPSALPGENGENGIIVFYSETTPSALGTASGAWTSLAEVDVTSIFANMKEGQGFNIRCQFEMSNATNATIIKPVSVRVALGPDSANARPMNLPNELPVGGVLYVTEGTVIGGAAPGRTTLFASSAHLEMRIRRAGTTNADGVVSDGWFMPDGEPAGSSIFGNDSSSNVIPRTAIAGGNGVNQVNLDGTIKVFVQFLRSDNTNCDNIRLLDMDIDILTKS